ncbi:unnamed protein product [Leptosia nina]|uniref:Uncharacterized protein n=1 Tax=Leptosia nina TaxID=320188 RepID=A0AAV1J166_9NEOP
MEMDINTQLREEVINKLSEEDKSMWGFHILHRSQIVDEYKKLYTDLWVASRLRSQGSQSSTSRFNLRRILDELMSYEDALSEVSSDHIESNVDCSSRKIFERMELPPDVRRLITEKNRATRAFIRYPTPENRRTLRAWQRAVKQNITLMRIERHILGILYPSSESP